MGKERSVMIPTARYVFEIFHNKMLKNMLENKYVINSYILLAIIF